MRKVCALSCSARKNGNCVSALSYAAELIRKRGFEAELLHMSDFEIKPCTKCSMECYFEKPCPNPDESEKLLKLLEAADGVIVASPVYNGGAPAQLRCFLERLPFPYDEVLQGKATGAVVVGSLGVVNAATTLASWLAPGKLFVGWVELDPRATTARNPKLRGAWLKGNLMENEHNRKQVEKLVSMLLNALERLEPST